MFHILIVEDDGDSREDFRNALKGQDYQLHIATDGAKALEIFYNAPIDLLITDLTMPKMDGYELIKTLRDARFTIPILVITAKRQFESMERAFHLGADDYMIKPVNPAELALRTGALLRRTRFFADQKLTVGNTVLVYDALTATVDGLEIQLPQKEFFLLYKLLSSPNKIFTRQQLMDEIWGMFSESDERTVNTHINRLRKRFSHCDDFKIVSIRGLGYKAVLATAD